MNQQPRKNRAEKKKGLPAKKKKEQLAKKRMWVVLRGKRKTAYRPRPWRKERAQGNIRILRLARYGAGKGRGKGLHQKREEKKKKTSRPTWWRGGCKEPGRGKKNTPEIGMQVVKKTRARWSRDRGKGRVMKGKRGGRGETSVMNNPMDPAKRVFSTGGKKPAVGRKPACADWEKRLRRADSMWKPI